MSTTNERHYALYIRYYALVALIAGLCAGCGSEPPQRPASEDRITSLSAEARAALAEGQRLLEVGRYADGLRMVNRLDSLVPSLPEAALLRGSLLSSSGQRHEAVGAFKRALALDPNLEGIRHNLGNLAFEDQRYADAARWYRAEAERFDAPRPWHGLGGAYTALGKADSARSAFERAIQLDLAYIPARLSLAEWHEANGDPEAALDLLDPLLAGAPDDPTLAYRVGLLRVQMGEMASAEEVLRHAVEVEPWNYGALLALGRTLQRQGDPAADSVLARGTEVRREQALVERLERQVRAVPDDFSRRVALAAAYRRTGRLDDALEAYRAALGQRPRSAPLLTNVGVLLLQLGATDEGVSHLRQALAADSTFGPAWINLWAHYGRIGDIRSAEAAFARARRFAPDHPAVQAYASGKAERR